MGKTNKIATHNFPTPVILTIDPASKALIVADTTSDNVQTLGYRRIINALESGRELSLIVTGFVEEVD